jgi:hypothetical protein
MLNARLDDKLIIIFGCVRPYGCLLPPTAAYCRLLLPTAAMVGPTVLRRLFSPILGLA